MKKILLAFFLAFAFADGFSQKLTFQGTVLDSKGTPIPFATISLDKEAVGTVSTDDGSFRLIFSEAKSDSVVVYCLGYNRRAFSIKELKGDKAYTVRLSDNSFSINEVVVCSRKLRVKRVENRSKEGNTYSGALGAIVLYKIEGVIGRKLRDVQFYIEKQKIDAYVGFRLFKVGRRTGLPEEELLDTNIVLKVKKGDKLVKVNVARFNIVVPAEGVYVGLEMLGDASHKQDEAYASNRVRLIMTTNVNRKNTYVGFWRSGWSCYSSEVFGGKYTNMKVSFSFYEVAE